MIQEDAMIFAGIVAGGSGMRMKNADKPKQFLELGGVPILIRTVMAFEKVHDIDRIYIGINPQWHEYAQGLLEKYGMNNNRIVLLDGGADRNGTIFKILDAITAEYEISGNDVLLTHDAVRPFVSEKIIRDNISAAKEFSVCGTYIPSVDTVIRSTDGCNVKENLIRSELFRAQTPQSFCIKKLCECIEKLGEEKIASLTDACGIFTECGIPIRMVEGDDLNFKITTDPDLFLAKAVVKQLQETDNSI